MMAMAKFTDWLTGETEKIEAVDVVACKPCEGTGEMSVGTCIICGGKGVVIKGGFFDSANGWTVRNAVLI